MAKYSEKVNKTKRESKYAYLWKRLKKYEQVNCIFRDVVFFFPAHVASDPNDNMNIQNSPHQNPGYMKPVP